MFFGQNELVSSETDQKRCKHIEIFDPKVISQNSKENLMAKKENLFLFENEVREARNSTRMSKYAYKICSYCVRNELKRVGKLYTLFSRSRKLDERPAGRYAEYDHMR